VSDVWGRAESAKVKETSAFRKLVGNGGSMKIAAGDQKLEITAAAVKRHGSDQMLGDMREEIAVRLQSTSASPEQHQQFKTDFEALLKEAVRSFSGNIEDEAFGRDFAAFMRTQMDEKDLTPDEVTQFVADVKNFLNTESNEKRNFTAGLKMSGLFGLAS